MPLVGFICPKHNGRVPFMLCTTCAEPCLPRPILWKMSQVKKFNLGSPSVTQCIAPVFQTFLREKIDYYENPFDMMYRMYGSAVHYFLEGYDKSSIVEQEFSDSQCTGIPDYFDFIDSTLWDYKTYGNYKVKMLMKDFNENGKDLILQVNKYRMILQHYGINVKKMMCQVMVRDFSSRDKKIAIENNLKVGKGLANSKGKKYEMKEVINEFEQFEIPLINDEKLNAYFEERIEKLHKLFEKGDGNGICVDESDCCPDDETWGGRRCDGYCPVNESCPKYEASKGEQGASDAAIFKTNENKED